MKTIFYSLLGAICFLFLSCDDDPPEPVIFPYEGPFGLAADETSLCPGSQTQLFLLSFASNEKGEKVPISELVFEPVPAEFGNLFSHGIFKAPDVISETRMVPIKAKFKNDPNLIVSMDLELISPEHSNISFIEAFSLLEPVWGQPGLSDMNAKGDFVIGPMEHGFETLENFSLEATSYDSLGQKKWHYNGNGGNTSFLKFLDDHVLVSGYPIVRESNNIYKTVLLDENGQEVPGFNFPEALTPVGLYKNGNGDFFISSKDKRRPNISIIQKLNSDFEIEWQRNIDYPVDQFLVTNEEEILILFQKDYGIEAGLALFDRMENQVWKLNLENTNLYSAQFNSTHLIEMPDGNLGLIRSEGRSADSGVDWVYYDINKTGGNIQNREVIFSGISSNDPSFISGESNQKNVTRISKVLISKTGELLLLGTGNTKSNQYLVIKGVQKSSLEIKSATAYNVLQFIQNKSGIRITTLDYDVVKYQLGPNLEFNSCLAGI